MQKKRVLVSGYFAKNLGDDLLFKTLVSRYPGQGFDLFCFDYENKKHYGRLFEEYDVNILTLGFIKKILYKIYRKVTKRRFDCPFCKIDLESYKAVVFIGGSIFQEGGYVLETIDECFLKNRNIYVVGSSFGPYKTENYVRKTQKSICRIKDICFRDFTSYALFSEMANV